MYTYHIYSTLKQGKSIMFVSGKVSKFELATLLFSKMGKANYFVGSNGELYLGYLLAITKEDGGSQSYNLLVNGCDHVKYSFHIRTVD